MHFWQHVSLNSTEMFAVLLLISVKCLGNAASEAKAGQRSPSPEAPPPLAASPSVNVSIAVIDPPSGHIRP